MDMDIENLHSLPLFQRLIQMKILLLKQLYSIQMVIETVIVMTYKFEHLSTYNKQLETMNET